jgi:hypothetical protein
MEAEEGVLPPDVRRSGRNVGRIANFAEFNRYGRRGRAGYDEDLRDAQLAYGAL